MLAEDRNTKMKDAELVPVPVAANAVGYAGGIVMADANGYGVKGQTALNLTYLGRSEEPFDNTGGANGDVTILVRRGKAFYYANSGSDPVTQAGLGKVCYVEDDETVAATDGVGTRSAGGVVVGLDSYGVWVE